MRSSMQLQSEAHAIEPKDADDEVRHLSSCAQARYEILRSCLTELARVGIIDSTSSPLPLPWVDIQVPG